jgi:multimeric flavodoxin WrbA
MAREVTTSDVEGADAYTFGSSFHFSIISGEILTMFTNIYTHRHEVASKPAWVFTAGADSQVTTLRNMDRILDDFNPKPIELGIAVEGSPKAKGLEQEENYKKNSQKPQPQNKRATAPLF